MQQHLTPWMIESAYRYWEAAKHLLNGHDMMAVAQVNAAIGMEILLKSFVARPNGNHGQVNETYDLDAELIKDAHRELQRVGKVPADRKQADKLTSTICSRFSMQCLQRSGRAFDSTRRKNGLSVIVMSSQTPGIHTRPDRVKATATR